MKKRNEYMIKSIILLSLLPYTGLMNAQTKITEFSLKEPKNGIYVIAHRGVHNGITEN